MTDTYKVLGQIESTAGSVVPLYAVPAGKQAVSSALSIVNTGGSTANYSLFAVPGSEYESITVFQENSWDRVGSSIYGTVEYGRAGTTVSLSDNGLRLVVGIPGADSYTTFGGEVRVYDWAGNSWEQIGQTLASEANEDRFGSSVSISADGSRVAIGASRGDGSIPDVGHVRIYELSDSSWVQVGQDIDGEAAQDQFGTSVSISGDGQTVAIGAPNKDGDGESFFASGGVKVYSLSDSVWVQIGADIIGNGPMDSLGSSVSISADGSRLVVGAPSGDVGVEAITRAGYVRVFDWNGSSWVQVGVDISGDAEYASLGRSVSISSDGTRIAVGRSNFNSGPLGATDIYEWSGSSWVQLGQSILGEYAYDGSGGSVSISGDGSTVAIGSASNNDGGDFAGSARIYRWDGLLWSQLAADIDGEPYDYSGTSVSISENGSRIAVGSPFNFATAVQAGKVNVYDYFPDSTVLVPQNKHALIKSKVIEIGEHHTISGGITLPSETQLVFSSDTDSLVTSIFGVEIS
jgi:hypothetical protein